MKNSKLQILKKVSSTEDSYKTQKLELPKLEMSLNREKIKMARLNQETGIVKNKYLKNDFISRKKNIDALRDEKSTLEVS